MATDLALNLGNARETAPVVATNQMASQTGEGEGAGPAGAIRDAVQKLHHGLSLVAEEFDATANQSAFQISLLTENLEALAAKMEALRTETAGANSALGQHLTQTVGQITIQISALASNFEALANGAGDAKTQSVDTAQKLETALAHTQGALDDLSARQGEASTNLTGLDVRFGAMRREFTNAEASRSVILNSLTADLDALKTGLSETRQISTERDDAIESQVVRGQHELKAMDERLGDVVRSVAETLDSLTSRKVEANEAVEERLAAVDRALADLDERHSGDTRSISYRLDAVTRGLGEVRAHALGSARTLDERVGFMQRSTEELALRLRDASQLLADKTRALIEKVDDIEIRADETGDALDRQIRALQRKIDELGSRQNPDPQLLADQLRLLREKAGMRQSDAAQAVEALGRKYEEIRQDVAKSNFLHNGSEQELVARLDDVRGEMLEKIAALERRLASSSVAPDQQMSSDPGAAEYGGQQRVEEALAALNDKIRDVESRQRSAMAGLRAEVIEASLSAVNARLDASETQIADKFAPFKSNDEPPLPVVTDHEYESDADEYGPPPPPPAAVPPPFGPPTGELPHAIATELPVGSEDGSIEHSTDLPFATFDPPVIPAADRSNANGEDEPAESYISAARRAAMTAAEQQSIVGASTRRLSLNWFQAGAKGEKAGRMSTRLIGGIAIVVVLAGIAQIWLSRSHHTAHATKHAIASLHRPTGKMRPKTLASHTQRSATAEHASALSATVTNQTGAGSSGTSPATGDIANLLTQANMGNAHAQLLLGLRAFDDKQNPASGADAAKWLTQAANQGDAIAEYHLGMLYEAGRGVDADPAKAVQWYRAAATLGNRDAMNNLAVAYAQGTGITRDAVEAARWFSNAANLGLVEAQFDLAVLYERGEGVSQSLPDAYRWYAIAAKAGDKQSISRADVLATQISPQERAAAEKSAADFAPAAMDLRANVVLRASDNNKP